MALLAPIVTSWQKSRELAKVSTILGARPNNLLDLADLKAKQAAALLRLWAMLRTDRTLAAILMHYRADEVDLERSYRRLAITGGGQWAKHHWVAASAFAFGGTLDYTMRMVAPPSASYDEIMDASLTLAEYFLIGRVGAVDGGGPRRER